MYLSNIKLWNFRKYGSLKTIDLEKPNLDLNFNSGINVLIGENDSGKTAIIDAIKLVLKTHSYEWIKSSLDDFHQGASRFRIELEFKGLNDNEAKNFTEWIGWEGEKEEAKPFLRLIYDVKLNPENNSILPTDIKAGVDNIGSALNAEAKEYLKTTYLKPLRDAQSELIPRKNSRLSQILLGHEAFKNKGDKHILVDIFKELNESIEQYFEGKDNSGETLNDDLKGKELKDEINKYIKAFHGELKEASFESSGGTLKQILERLELSLKDEINPGLGTLNRLFMASELLHLQKKDWSGIRLGLIEELEAHLHPQSQMQVIEALQKEENIQLILTSHSPNLGSKVKLDNLIICHSNSAYPLGKKHTKLEDDDYLFLERFLDATKANLFFAKGVIFVEGWSEEILLPAFVKKLKQQDILSKNLTEAGISIVNVGSTAFLRYSRIFLRKNKENKINIPVSIITDVDIKTYAKTEQLDVNGKIIKKGKNTVYDYTPIDVTEVAKDSVDAKVALEKKYDKQNVKAFVAPSWTLEYSLFKSASLLPIFSKAIKKVHPQIDEKHLERELAKKLINKGLDKTELAYELAQELEKDSNSKNPKIDIDITDSHISYLIDAIKYACND